MTTGTGFPVFASLQQLVALQADARSLRMPSPRRRANPRQGGHLATVRGRGMALAEVRPYQPGDDVRRIDWRITARRQEPHTKIYEEERERPVLLICDLGPTTFFGSQGAYKQVRCAQTAALLAWLGLSSGDQVGGVVFNGDRIDVIRPARRKKTVLRLLDALASRQWQSAPAISQIKSAAQTLDEALTEARRIAHTGSRIFLLSDFESISDSLIQQLGALAQHNSVTAIELTDPLDQRPPSAGRYAVRGTGGTFWFDAANPDLQEAWRKRAESRHQHLEQLFRQTTASYLSLSTADHPTTLLRSLTGQGGRLL